MSDVGSDKKVEADAVKDIAEVVTEDNSEVVDSDKSSKESQKELEIRMKKELFRQVLLACAGVVAGTAVMFGIMVLCMSFSWQLLWGSLLGMANAALYWLLLYMSKTTVVRVPYIGRMVILVALVIVGLKFDCFYNWAVLIPLAFTKPLAYVFLFIESRKS